ncbi:MAG: glycosyltransferase family 4 protein [Acidobacteria bacterium]|nr:glycosyltransferase family 4 protein [Acidobacteriota bacterium]
MTRVLFLTESFHPVLGGGETHIRQLGGQLAALGHVATVVTRRGGASWPSVDEVDGVRVRRVRPPGPARTGKYLMVPAALCAVLHEGPRHDVLVVRGTRVLGVPGLLVARALGRPVILQPEVNGELSGEAFTWGWRRGRALQPAVRGLVALRNVWMRDAEAFVAMSRRIRDEIVGAGVAPERVALIPHGVDTERFRPAVAGEREALRRALGLPGGLLAVFTGRLLRGKGLETLLVAFADVASARPDLHLVLVGSGEGQALSVEEDLKAEVRERGLGDRVTFTGRVDAVEGHLRAADLFVFPSVFEGLGISLVEAAACGLPAVASRTGGIVDVIEEGRSGVLVTPGEGDALARALLSLAGDDRAREQMGTRARAVARERFDQRDATRRYLSLFQEVSARR